MRLFGIHCFMFYIFSLNAVIKLQLLKLRCCA